MTNVRRPALEGTVAVRGDRRLSFAEYGSRRGAGHRLAPRHPGGPTPDPDRGARLRRGARPADHRHRPARDRLVDRARLRRRAGLDRRPRPGPTPWGWTTSSHRALRRRALRAGGGRGLPDRVRSVAVLGGVAPTVGEDAAAGGLVRIALPFAPLLAWGRVPLSLALTNAMRVARPLGGTAIDRTLLQPRGDRRVLGRPEFRAMFIDDLVNGSRQAGRRPGGRPAAVHPPLGVRPRRRAGPGAVVARRRRPHRAVATRRALRRRLPDARLFTLEGESHLGGLTMAEDVLTRWSRSPAPDAGCPAQRIAHSCDTSRQVTGVPCGAFVSTMGVRQLHTALTAVRLWLPSGRDRWGRRTSTPITREATGEFSFCDQRRFVRPLGAVSAVPAHRVGHRRRARPCGDPGVDPTAGPARHLPRGVLLDRRRRHRGRASSRPCAGGRRSGSRPPRTPPAAWRVRATPAPRRSVSSTRSPAPTVT